MIEGIDPVHIHSPYPRLVHHYWQPFKKRLATGCSFPNAGNPAVDFLNLQLITLLSKRR
ncbi:MAG: hypothetical protein ABIJ65_06745 [Chloroflexota bacterium]